MTKIKNQRDFIAGMLVGIMITSLFVISLLIVGSWISMEIKGWMKMKDEIFENVNCKCGGKFVYNLVTKETYCDRCGEKYWYSPNPE